MRVRLFHLWESIRTSFWFIPALLIVCAALFALSIIALDRQIGWQPEQFWGFMYAVDPDGARSILSTIAGSMMTVAGVTFSITIVALNLAANQFGPRLLRNFIGNRKTQMVLGVFLATFIYCLLVLRSIHTFGETFFVPHLAVTIGVVLAVMSVGVLVFFIHHIAQSIQADRVAAEIGRELEQNIQRIFSAEERIEADVDHTGEAGQHMGAAHFSYLEPVKAVKNGYLQAIDYDSLLALAQEKDYVILFRTKPGAYICRGQEIAATRSDNKVQPEHNQTIAEAFLTGEQRTPEQDVEYSIHQLVEVAVRALSPGTNDPYTAITCIDLLSSSLCLLAQQTFPSPYKCDDNNIVRLIAVPPSFTGCLNAAFDQIRQYGSESVAVTIRLMEALEIIAAQACTDEQRNAVERQATMIWTVSKRLIPEKNDQDDLRNRYQNIHQSLDHKI